MQQFVQRTEIHPDRLIIRIDRMKLALMLAGDQVDVSRTNTDAIAILDLPHKLKRRGVETKIVLGNISGGPHHDAGLITLIANAHRCGRASFYRWRKAYRNHGEAGLANARSVPHIVIPIRRRLKSWR